MTSPGHEMSKAAETDLQAVADGPESCPDCGGPIICPECPGCACWNGRCTGWRHWGSVDFELPDNDDGDHCGECGAAGCDGYRCDC